MTVCGALVTKTDELMWWAHTLVPETFQSRSLPETWQAVYLVKDRHDVPPRAADAERVCRCLFVADEWSARVWVRSGSETTHVPRHPLNGARVHCDKM